MAALQDYSLPVHKSLQQPDLLLGVPKPVFVILIVSTMVLIYLFGPVFALSGLVFYIPCYFISKDDPCQLMITLDSLSQVDYLEG